MDKIISKKQFPGLEKASEDFNEFDILSWIKDPENFDVKLMLIKFKNGELGLCIYNVDRKEFIEEPDDLDQYETTEYEIYKKYGLKRSDYNPPKNESKLITKFDEFINEEISNLGTPIRRYFLKNSLSHEHIIGKKVMDKNGNVWYINKIDPIRENTRLPYQIYCSTRPESEFGKYLNTDELYIPDDIDYIQSQSQIQSPQVQESDQTVAREILNQLGGHKFMVMTGAKNLVSDDNSLMFRIPKAKDSINYVKITLTSMDLYDVEYGRIRGDKYTIVNTEEGLYNDMLAKNFEKNTGLYTKLF